jgi:hypothetical protein
MASELWSESQERNVSAEELLPKFFATTQAEGATSILGPAAAGTSPTLASTLPAVHVVDPNSSNAFDQKG